MLNQSAEILAERTPLARATDPVSSQEAGDDAETTRQLVLSFVWSLFQQAPNGLTDVELNDAYEVALGLGQDIPNVQWDTPRRRRSELANMGHVLATSKRRESRISGKRITVWAAV